MDLEEIKERNCFSNYNNDVMDLSAPKKLKADVNLSDSIKPEAEEELKIIQSGSLHTKFVWWIYKESDMNWRAEGVEEIWVQRLSIDTLCFKIMVKDVTAGQLLKFVKRILNDDNKSYYLTYINTDLEPDLGVLEQLGTCTKPNTAPVLYLQKSTDEKSLRDIQASFGYAPADYPINFIVNG